MAANVEKDAINICFIKLLTNKCRYSKIEPTNRKIVLHVTVNEENIN